MKHVFREVLLGAMSCAAAGMFLSANDQAMAQSAGPRAAPNQQGQVIRRVVVEGNQRVETSTVTSYMLIAPGSPFDAERIDQSLKALFATGLFADVQILQRDSDLVVRVVENPIISRVVFEGVKKVGQDDLEKEIQAKPRGVFTAARAQSDVQRIIEVYRRAGYFAATVTPQVKELDQNRVDLIFKVDEGPVTGVRAINFIGNNHFDDGELRSAIRTEQSKWWKFFSSNDNYDPDRIEYDRELLRQFYTNKGYADFKIVSAIAELTPDQKDFYITFTVDEGEKFTFGDVKVETELEKVSSEALKSSIPIKSGDEFQGKKIEDSIDAMTFLAGTVGYANVDIRPRVERDRENHKVNLVFEVNEGPRVYIDRIDIVGNTRTIDPVIRRELKLAEGDAFNRVLLERSKQRLQALGFFKTVEIEEREGSQPDRSVVEVKVEEESTGELSFAAGYSSSDSFLFDASISERNLRGRGQFLRLRISTSQRRQQVDIRFTEPRFLGRNLAAGFDIFSLRTDYVDESGFENQSTGGSLRASFPITDSTNLGTSYTLRQDDTQISATLCDPLFNPTPPALCTQSGEFVTSVGSYVFNWDKRNNPVKPTGGFDLTVRQDLAGLGGEVKYLRTEVEGGLYKGIVKDVTAKLRLSAGYVFGWGGDDVRINDRFFKGGSSFRGFDVAGLGPRQMLLETDNTNPLDPFDTLFTGTNLGGKAYAIASAELEIPVPLPKEYGISAALFSDFGTVGLLDDQYKQTVITPQGAITYTSFVEDELSLRASAGLSIFWESPFGPVQFDFAEPFMHEDYDSTQAFRFSTRTRF